MKLGRFLNVAIISLILATPTATWAEKAPQPSDEDLLQTTPLLNIQFNNTNPDFTNVVKDTVSSATSISPSIQFYIVTSYVKGKNKAQSEANITSAKTNGDSVKNAIIAQGISPDRVFVRYKEKNSGSAEASVYVK